MFTKINGYRGQFDTEAQAIAFGIMQSVLGQKMAGEQKRNTWSDTLSGIVQTLDAVSGMDAAELTQAGLTEETAKPGKIVESFFADVRLAIGSASVAENLAAAGYGDFSQTTVDADGKESTPSSCMRKIQSLYGSRFTLVRARKDALATLEKYQRIIAGAVQYGVTLEIGMTGAEVSAATKKAKLAADPVAAAAAQAEDDKAKAAKMAGETFSGLHAKGNPELQAVIGLFAEIAAGWEGSDAVLRESFAEALLPWAIKFAANGRGEDESGTDESEAESEVGAVLDEIERMEQIVADDDAAPVAAAA